VSLARGSIGNPWIFADFAARVAGRPIPPPPTPTEQAEVILEHCRLAEELYGPEKGERSMRKFLIRYAAHHPDPEGVKAAWLAARTPADRARVVAEWYQGRERPPQPAATPPFLPQPASGQPAGRV
jgi:tRNA-dihydrouridine synthase